jgi:DNA-binding transcriptional ArsR family regulator
VRYRGSMTASAPSPSLALGRLADERRLRVFAALALGSRTVEEVADATELQPEEAARALASLVKAGLVIQGSGGLEVDRSALAGAARAASTPRVPPAIPNATPEQAAVVRNFVDASGRLYALPARDAKRHVVLEWVAAQVEPGRAYTEREINVVLGDCTPIT